jgi:hypothetical protein
MSSIFDLKTSTTELSSSNAGTSRMLYEQHPPTRDITNGAFPNGAIHNRFTVSGQKWWVPARSYLRMRCSITAANGAQLPVASNIGPNMGLMSNLFQSGEFRIADKTVSRVSDFMAAVDSLDTRLSKSKSWLDSVGESSNMWEADTKFRIQKISADGADLKSHAVSTTTNTGRVALGFDAAGGGGNDRNAAAYTAATGRIVFTQNGGAALPADVRVLFPVGSYFSYTVVQGGADGTVNVLMEVIAGIGVDEIEVRSVVAADVPADGRTDFQRVENPENLDPSRRVKSFELLWQPPMSIFKIGHALPSGKYELTLNPQTAQIYKKRAIESLGADKGAGVDFDFSITDMYLYTAVVDGPRADDITYLIDLEETRCQVDTVSAASTSLQQRNFDVSPSTYALTLAFQDESAGQLTQYSASKFKSRNNTDLNLTRMYLNYAGQNKPQPDADPAYVVGDAKDYTTQRYIESLLHSGSYFDAGGSETIQEWQARGPYYYFSWPRDGTDRSTRVNVNFQFGVASPSTRVLLFDHYKAVARIQVSDGRVVDVQVDDA